jgi:pimeloyl-ACP methyl ester carboxylesterase
VINDQLHLYVDEARSDMNLATKQRLRLSGGTEVAYIAAGDPSKPAVLLLHGSPSSAQMFREVVPGLSQDAYAIAPDLPGFGESDVLPSPSFPAMGQAILELLDIVARMSPAIWEEDWRVMNLPGRMDTQRALIKDYGKYVERFDAIADYLKQRQPPALMIWGRHDPFFELAEVLSWMQALPRMDAHILDAGHKLLETHSAAALPLMRGFIRRTAP